MTSSPENNFLRFKSSIKTMSLSTLTDTGQPNISYAPFVTDDDGFFYVFLSQLASHTQDLLNQPVASIMLMEDEQNSRQLFARQRITYHCAINIIQSGYKTYDEILNNFESSFGSIIPLLRNLPDFILFKLSPTEGRYVEGFGKAYELAGENLTKLKHVTS